MTRPQGPWLVRLLLRLYPKPFRNRYGPDLEASFHDVVERARARGAMAWVWAWIRGIADLLGGAVREAVRGTTHADRRARSSRDGGRETMGSVIRDVRHAVRSLWNQPLFTVVAAGSLAIGIGAATVAMSAVDELFLEPLPGIENFDRVVELGRTRRGSGFDSFSYPDFQDIRDQVPSLAASAAYSLEILSFSRDAGGVRAGGFHVTPSYFQVLGARPGLGRFFTPDEDIGVGEHFVAVVSHAFWRERLGADPDILGQTILLNRLPYTVVGVTEEGFGGHMFGFQPDVFMPMVQAPVMNAGLDLFEQRGSSWHLALGLLGDGATLEGLNRELDALGARLAEAYPESNSVRGFRAMPLGPIPGAGRTGIGLFVGVILGMVALILLVTCTNIAGMFLARATTRERDVAVRVALGAGRGTIMQQLTVETLVVFALGGGAGIVLGLWATGFLRPEMLPLPVPVRFSLEPDLGVLLTAAGLSLATGILFGLLPAARATRLDVVSTMKDEGRGGGRRSGRARRVFAGAQVGLSLVLLVTAALFVRSLQRAASIDAGFEPRGAWVSFIDLSLEGYDEEEGRAFQVSLLDRLRAEAWTSSASLSTDLPLDLASSGTSVTPQGWARDEDASPFRTDFNLVSDGYFQTLGIPILRGRGFTPADGPDVERVVVVSETFAQEAWPGEDPIGKSVEYRRDPDHPQYEVVGVVANVKNQVITEAAEPFMYLPIRQMYGSAVRVVVRSEAPPRVAQAGLRETLDAADARMSRVPVSAVEDYTALGVLPQRIAAYITSGLGMLALLLSGLGVYGVVSFAVGRQRREIGIRMALGADARAVAWRFLRGGLLLALPGMAVGAVLAVAAGRLLGALLLDLSPHDPVALGSVGALLLAVVGLAAWIPARRAASVDPASSLRSD